MIGRGSLTSHIARAYALGIAFALLALVVVGTLLLHVRWVGEFRSQTMMLMGTLVSHAAVAGAPKTQADLARLVAGTSYPGFEMGVVAGSSCYWVTWPQRLPGSGPAPEVRADPRCEHGLTSDWMERTAALFAGYSSPLTMVGRDLVQAAPMQSTFAAEVRQALALLAAGSLIVIAFAIWAGRRIALRVMAPVRALQESLDAIHPGDTMLRDIPVVGDSEVGRLIESIKHASDVKAQALAEMRSAHEHTHEFVADAGHQLRTPLSVLRGFTSILRNNRLRHPDDGPKILEKMDAQIARMTQLVEALMLLESWQLRDEYSTELVDVGVLTLELVAPLLAVEPVRDVRVDAVHGALARINATEFGYALTNLVTNAFKYAPEGVIEIAIAADEEHIYVSVEDHGPGMSPEVLAHAFDRFYRGPRRDVPGSGLGLAIALRAAKRANGSLIAESTEGAGSRFIITLPRDPARCQLSLDRQPRLRALSWSP